MKRFVIVVVLSVLATVVFASGTGEDSLTGTWYGGSVKEDHMGWKYMYTFTPVGRNQWSVLVDPAYNPELWGSPVSTKWTGGIVKIDDGYRMRIMMMYQPDVNIPPMEHPVVVAYEATVELTGENELQLTYVFGAEYRLEQRPFVDTPVDVYKGPGDPVTLASVISHWLTLAFVSAAKSVSLLMSEPVGAE